MFLKKQPFEHNISFSDKASHKDHSIAFSDHSNFTFKGYVAIRLIVMKASNHPNQHMLRHFSKSNLNLRRHLGGSGVYGALSMTTTFLIIPTLQLIGTKHLFESPILTSISHS